MRNNDLCCDISYSLSVSFLIFFVVVKSWGFWDSIENPRVCIKVILIIFNSREIIIKLKSG